MKKIILFILSLTVQVLSQSYQPGDHEVLIMPTAYTMPKGSAYFSDYEVFLLSSGYAVTSTTHISAAVLFPVYKGFYNTATFGIKQNYYRSNGFSGAAFSSITVYSGAFLIGNVFSLGTPERNFNIGVAYYSQLEESRNSQFVYMLGSKFDVSRSVSILAEFDGLNYAYASDFNGGIISLGLRFRSDDITWEIAGIRDLSNNSGSLLFFPFVKATLIL